MWNLEKCYRSSYLQNGNKETDADNKCMDIKGGRRWDEFGNWD